MNKQRIKAYLLSFLIIITLFNGLTTIEVGAGATTIQIKDTQQEDVYTDSSLEVGAAYSKAECRDIKDLSNRYCVNYVGFDEEYGYERSAVKFDISGISGTVASAKLRIYVVDTVGNPVVNLLSTVNDNWTEGEGASTFPSYNLASIIGTYSNSPVTGNSWNEFDVTNYIQSSIGKTNKKVSFVLTGTEAPGITHYFNFINNQETVLTASKPVLEITYSALNVPVVTGAALTKNPKPTWSWMTGGGGTGTFRYKLDSSDLTTGATVTTATSYTPASVLSDGSHTLYVQESNGAGGWSASGSRTITIDATPPGGYSISIDQAVLNNENKSALSFSFVGAEIGTAYSYTVYSSGGGTSVTGNGTISSASQQVSGINTSSLNDGILTVSVTLRDAAGNIGTAATDTVQRDTAPVIVPHMTSDKAKYIQRDIVPLSLSLTGTSTGDKTNSVTFEIDYDGTTFEPVGGAMAAVNNGYIPFNTKMDLGTGGIKRLLVTYVHIKDDIALQEGKKLFTVNFKVKDNPQPGIKTFTLKPVNMLDSSSKVYNINDDNPLSKNIEVTNDAVVQGDLSIYLGEAGTAWHNRVLDDLKQSQINEAFKNLKFILKHDAQDTGTVLNGSDVFIPDEDGNLAVKGVDGRVTGRFRLYTQDTANTQIRVEGPGYLAETIDVSLVKGAIYEMNDSILLYPGDIGRIDAYQLVLSPDGRITNADFSEWLQIYNSYGGDNENVAAEDRLLADYTKDGVIDVYDFSLWYEVYEKMLVMRQ